MQARKFALKSVAEMRQLHVCIQSMLVFSIYRQPLFLYFKAAAQRLCELLKVLNGDQEVNRGSKGGAL